MIWLGEFVCEINKVKHCSDFIKKFENESGIKFNKVHLYTENELLTKSRKYMNSHMKNHMTLTMIVSSEPVRIMDEDVSTISTDSLACPLEIENMENIFGKIETWDVSFITDMSFWFCNNEDNDSEFNSNISKWDVSSVKDMTGIFMRCKFQPTHWLLGYVKM